MDPQPKALRTSLLVTTAFVLIGGVAGFALFLQQWTPAPVTAPPSPDVEFDGVVTRPMAAPASLDAVARARLFETIEKATNDPSPAVRTPASEALIELGASAVPSLLDLLHGFAATPAGFEDPMARFRLSAADLPLRKIRARLTPDSRAIPYERSPNAAWALRRVKSWFAWWDAYAAAHPEPR